MLATLKQTAELVEFFRLHGTKQTFKKGDFIIRPGDPPHGVFYIYQGLVKAYDITKYNEENLLIIRKQDEIFPLIWAVTGNEHHIIYQALAPTTTYKIDRAGFPGVYGKQLRCPDTPARHDNGNVSPAR
jgi:CRP-like cAMP-binding protein